MGYLVDGLTPHHASIIMPRYSQANQRLARPPIMIQYKSKTPHNTRMWIDILMRFDQSSQEFYARISSFEGVGSKRGALDGTRNINTKKMISNHLFIVF